MALKVKEIFGHLSDHLRLKFEMSSELNHNTLRGNVREDTLSTFLSNGMLPKKFDVGTGEIISTNSAVSKQCDLVIYDSLNSAPLYYEPAAQVFPIEIVCGTIEIKSKLSKNKLIEGLENIKSMKSLGKSRIPFGIVFAYSLNGNSLDSLAENLRDWEKEREIVDWPELIVVNGEGVIYHSNDHFSFCRPQKGSEVVYRELNKETFFSFYSIFINLLQEYKYQDFSILDYYYMPILIGDMLVYNHDNIVQDGKVFSLNEQFLIKVKSALSTHIGEENLPYHFFFDKLGILGNKKLRVYNPNGYDMTFKEEWLENPELFGGKLSYVMIDEYLVVYPANALNDEDLSVVEGKKPEDL